MMESQTLLGFYGGEKGDLKVGCQDGTCLEDGACLGAGAWGEALGNSLRDLPHRLYSL